jgi:hypothetical protein
VPEENSETHPSPESLHREKARLRMIGAIVLAVGIIGAGLVYWIPRPQDPALAQYEQAQARAESRQMQMLYGTSGGVTEDFLNWLKQPGAQAGVIVVVSGLIAAGCFYLGRPFGEREE